MQDRTTTSFDYRCLTGRTACVHHQFHSIFECAAAAVQSAEAENKTTKIRYLVLLQDRKSCETKTLGQNDF